MFSNSRINVLVIDETKWLLLTHYIFFSITLLTCIREISEIVVNLNIIHNEYQFFDRNIKYKVNVNF